MFYVFRPIGLKFGTKEAHSNTLSNGEIRKTRISQQKTLHYLEL
jgi:hypothetical protein